MDFQDEIFQLSKKICKLFRQRKRTSVKRLKKINTTPWQKFYANFSFFIGFAKWNLWMKIKIMLILIYFPKICKLKKSTMTWLALVFQDGDCKRLGYAIWDPEILPIKKKLKISSMFLDGNGERQICAFPKFCPLKRN